MFVFAVCVFIIIKKTRTQRKHIDPIVVVEEKRRRQNIYNEDDDDDEQQLQININSHHP